MKDKQLLRGFQEISEKESLDVNGGFVWEALCISAITVIGIIKIYDLIMR